MPDRAEPQDDRIVVITDEGRRSTFPIMELQATRRTPRLETRADALPVHHVLRVIERARRAAEGCAIANDLIRSPSRSDPRTRSTGEAQCIRGDPSAGPRASCGDGSRSGAAR